MVAAFNVATFVNESCCQIQNAELEVVSVSAEASWASPATTESTAVGSVATNCFTLEDISEEVLPARPPRPSFKAGILRVETSLMRGISLRETLRNGGNLWRRSPMDLGEKARASLWLRSKSVEHFDVFLSHAWSTRGFWKFLSLSFDFGWRHAVFCWFLVVALIGFLAGFRILPMPGECLISFQDFEEYCPCGSWNLFGGVACSIAAFLLAPYLPDSRPQSCFLDVVSINQANEEKMLQGIYGLGGFLKASRELRILWSPPYLSRLWCIFELAAFRSANPAGIITLAPLCLEAAVAAFWLGGYATMCVFLAVLGLTGSYSILALVPALLPLFLVLHCLRRTLSMKQQLFADLEGFDLDKAYCRKESDRDFVHKAIIEWYGSLESFTAYVRGPLQQELQAMHSTTRLPLHYSFLIVTPVVSFGLDALLALWLAGAPTQIVLSYGIGVVLGLCTCWAMIAVHLSTLLCSYSISTNSSIMGWMQSLIVFLIFGAVTFAGVKVGALAYTNSLEASCIWLAGAVCLLWLVQGGLQHLQALFKQCKHRTDA